MSFRSTISPAAPQPNLGADRPAQRMFTAIAWTAAGKWATQLISWASVLVVLRLLTPSDFGLVGLATTYLGFIALISEFGIGAAVVIVRDLTESQIAQLHTVSVLLGAAGTLVSFACAVPIAQFFRSPDLALVIAVAGISFTVVGFRSVPYALLQRDQHFKRLSFQEVWQALAQVTSTILLILLGAGYWALVVSGIVGSIVGTALPLWHRRVSLAVPVFGSIRSSIVFSWRTLVTRISWYLYSNSDFVVAGRVLGTAALGSYTVAWTLANLPGEKIVTLIMRVTPSFFSAAQNDLPGLRRYLAVLTECIALVIFPILLGLALVATDLIPLLVGNKWDDAIPVIRLLAIYTLLRSVVTLLPQILHVVGENRFCMWWSLSSLVLLPPAFLLGSRWGTTGIALVWVLVYPVYTIPLYRRTLKSIDMPFASYLKVVRPAFFSSVAMIAVVYCVDAIFLQTLPVTLKLFTEVTLGALAYAATLQFVFGNQVRPYLMFLRDRLGGRNA